MPVTQSAIKAMKQNRKANERNKATKAEFRGKVKIAKKATTSDQKDLGKLASEACQAIDKAAKKGVIHKNTAARRKSRLMKSINKEIGKLIDLTSTKLKPKSPVAKAKPAAKKPATKKVTK